MFKKLDMIATFILVLLMIKSLLTGEVLKAIFYLLFIKIFFIDTK